MKVVKGKFKNGKVKFDKVPDIDGEVEVIIVFPEKKKKEKPEVEFDFESEAFKEEPPRENRNEERQKRQREPNFNFQDFLQDDRVRNIADILRKAGTELGSEIRKNRRK